MKKKSKYNLLFLLFILLYGNLKSDGVDSLLNLINNTNSDSLKVVLYIEISDLYLPEDIENRECIDSALFYAQKCNDEYLLALVSFHKASNLNFYSQYDSAIVLLKYAIEIFEKYDDTLHSAACWGEMGNAYCYQAIYDDCLDCFLKTYEYTILLNNTQYMGIVLNNIGNVYYFMDNEDKALEYFKKAYKIFYNDSSSYGIALSSNNVGSVFFDKKQYDSALFYLNIAEKTAAKINYLEQLAETSANLAKLYTENKNYSLAQEYSLKSIALNKQIGSFHGLAKTYWAYGVLLFGQKNYLKSKLYLDSAIIVSVDVGVTEYEKNSYFWLFRVDSVTGNYHSALLNYLKYTELKDSLSDNDLQKQIADLESSFNLKIQEQENQLLEEKNAKQQVQIQRQKLRSTFTTIGLVLFVILAVLLFNIIRQRKKYNDRLQEKNSEITQQKEEILTQNEILTSKNVEIERQRRFLQMYQQETLASINYALRIQIASLPNLENIKKIVSDLALIYLPRDIISGDFYFYTKIYKDKYAIAVADCTGHSVPGALMSILSIALLIEVTKENLDYTAAQIIGRVRELTKKSLKQKWGTDSILDGMDISFLIYDKNKNTLNYCGANRPLIYFRDNELNIVQGDRQPVSAYVVEKEFTDKYIQIKPNDIYYLFSDGFIDQLSEVQHSKYMLPKFKNDLSEIHNLPLNDQKNILIDKFQEHKGSLRQTDDVTILLLKF
ncbi:MAG: tetratricopeptide repeat protein [Bacteroidales bacterium]|nr:tetratricopeptide repeat protein [Bacteroidales bacterium]